MRKLTGLFAIVFFTAFRLSGQTNLTWQNTGSIFQQGANTVRIAWGSQYSVFMVATGTNGTDTVTITSSQTGIGPWSGSGQSSASAGPTSLTAPSQDINVSFFASASSSLGTTPLQSQVNVVFYKVVPRPVWPPGSVLTISSVQGSPTIWTASWPAASDQDSISYYTVTLDQVQVSPFNGNTGLSQALNTTNALSLGQHTVAVVATDRAGQTTASALSLTFTVTQPPTAPGTLSFSNIGSGSATASWAASSAYGGGNIVNYTLNWYKGSSTSGGSVGQQSVPAASTSFSIGGLLSSQQYTVTVSATDSFGLTSSITSGQFTTSLAAAPGPVTAQSLTPTGFTALWPAYSNATGYNVVIDNAAPVAIGTQGGYATLYYVLSGLPPNSSHSVQVQAVFSSGSTSAFSAPLNVTTDLPLVSLGAVTRPSSSTTIVPEAGGALSVDNHGDATYSIPLKIAPARSGLGPQLALVYNSGGGNGVVGVGWSLSTGFPSAIVRGRSIYARDNVIRGVTFTNSDKYYLDGKRLLWVSGGPEGTPGAVYRTEVDSFASFTATAIGSDANIDTFTEVDKQGNQLVYGKTSSTNDGYQSGEGETAGLAYAYALKSITDPLGNYVNFTYTNLGGGEYVLSEIDYTGSTGGAPQSSVLFSYESRSDQPITYIAGRTFNHRARLAVITAKSGSTVTAQFGLNYSNSSLDGTNFDPSPSAPNGRSRLVSLAPFHVDPQLLTLLAEPPIAIGWQSHVETLQPGPVTAGSDDYQYIDQSFTGADNTQIVTSDRSSFVIKVGDFDGDGKPDQLRFTLQGGLSITWGNGSNNTTPFTAAQNTQIGYYFSDAASGATTSGSLLRTAEGLALASRIIVADFTGDGRDDIAIQGFDGKLHVFVSQGQSFVGPVNDTNAPFVGGQGSINFEVNAIGQLNTWIGDHYYVKPMPCDLNGDGITDYVCITYQRIITYGGANNTVPNGYFVVRQMTGVISNGDGTFQSPFQIGGPAMNIPIATSGNVNMQGAIAINDLNSGVFAGDFNGDGLTDFLVLVPQLDNQPGVASQVYGGGRWAMYLNQGIGASGSPTFLQINSVIPNTAVLPAGTGGETVKTYYSPMLLGTTGYWGGIMGLFNSPGTSKTELTGFEGAGGGINNFIMDVNHDGLPDLVWYVANDQNEHSVASTSTGWYAMLNTGNFTSGNSGFVGPVKLPVFAGINAGTQGTSWSSAAIEHGLDYNGDGEKDYFIGTTNNGTPAWGSVFEASGPNTYFGPLVDLVTTVTDGLGKVTTVAYKAAKDSSIYTVGNSVTYPIKEFFSSAPVVAEVDQDSGTTGGVDRFQYQYSGNRIDLSGRGGLGFHSFITLDEQTNLFKYQFLAQSFPMTGLAQREQTYRYWLSNSTGEFRLIASQNNTVVFDQVQNPVGGAFGTVFPFISVATTSRWEDSSTAHFSFPIGSGASSDSELLFPQANPSSPNGPYVVVAAQSLFDSQTTPLITLPTTSTGFTPGDAGALSSGYIDTAVGQTNLSYLSQLSNKIVYGNLMQLTTTYDPSGIPAADTITSTVNNTYYAPSLATDPTGRLKTTQTSVVSGSYSDATPTHTYTYEGSSTRLVSDAVTAADPRLSFTRTFPRDASGRVTATTIAGDTTASDDQYLPQFSIQPQLSYTDATLDLPTSTQDAYNHITSTIYNDYVGLPKQVVDPNNDTTVLQYDGLGRMTYKNDSATSITTTVSYSLDSSQTVSPPSGSGLFNETSAYNQQTTLTARPTVTEYFDRLGRNIRTIKAGFAGQSIAVDTVYDLLGRVAAVSRPYNLGQTAYWTITSYDTLGRPSTVTAPNGTVTQYTYAGRATQTSVTASGKTEATVVLNDPMGNPIKVWDANHATGTLDPVVGSSVTPSLTFSRDGFGRMRSTTLNGTTQGPGATYDSLGNPLTTSDPDRGPESFVFNALGQKIRETDNNSNVTLSTFDHLGRIMGRTISESSGTTETDQWLYFDSSGSGAPDMMPLGSTGGWIGSLARKTESTTGLLGYGDPGSTFAYYYDTAGRPQIEVHAIDGTMFYSYTTYDGSNRVATVQDYWRPAGHESPSDLPYSWSSFGYGYTYDANSYVLNVHDLETTSRIWWAADTGSGYDYMDRPVKVQKGAADWTVRTYDPTNGTLTKIATGLNEGDTTIQNLSYTYDGFNNLKSRTDTLHSTTENLTYDLLNRLTAAGNGSPSYDPLGNITAKPDVTGTLSTAYAYDPNRINAVTSAWGYSIGYDGNGNVSSKSKSGESWNFKWSGLNMPRWVAKTTGSTTFGSQFDYDTDQSRVLQVKFNALSGGVPTSFTWKRAYGLGNVEVDYTNSASSGAPIWTNTTARVYVPSPDGIAGVAEFAPVAGSNGLTLTETDKVYHYDHLGSIEVITPAFSQTTTPSNNAQNLPGVYSEEPFGQRRIPTALIGAPTQSDPGGTGTLTPRGFTGHEMLDDLGLIHMNGRIYDPLLGRFLSTDPFIQNANDLQTYNRYSYVQNNPLSKTDPTGYVAGFDDFAEIEVGTAAAYGALAVTSYVALQHSNEITAAVLNRVADARAAYQQRTSEAKLSGNVVAPPRAGDQGRIANTQSNDMSATHSQLPNSTAHPAPVANDTKEGFTATAAATATSTSTPADNPASIQTTTGTPAPNVAGPLRTDMASGIYEFPDKTAGDKTYVGQSGDTETRLGKHEAAGRLQPGTETVTPVEGGKTAREVAEHKRIQELTGGVPARQSDKVANKVDPIGPNRQHLLDPPGN